MTSLDLWQLLANVVTVFGLPLAIYTFILEQRKERENEDEEVAVAFVQFNFAM